MERAYNTTANSTATQMGFTYNSVGGSKAQAGNAILIFREIQDNRIELTIVEKPWSKDPIVLIEEIRVDREHEHDSSGPHLNITTYKGENNNAIKVVREDSIIAEKILGHRINLNESQIAKIEQNGVTEIYEIVSEKINQEYTNKYEVFCISKVKEA
ncbi:MAG: hypothetical protein WC821_01160 [archaeon]|jgi:hypothetical protein